MGKICAVPTWFGFLLNNLQTCSGFLRVMFVTMRNEKKDTTKHIGKTVPRRPDIIRIVNSASC